MSLEAIIEANTAAVRDLIAALNAQSENGTAIKVAETVVNAAETVAATTTEKKEPAKKEPAPAPAPATKTEEPAADEGKEVTYDEAAKAVTALGKTKGRAAAVAVLEAFGAKNLQGVKPEDFAAVVKACAEA